ncbi:ABC transporter ATP-binding protein [Ligaoa zhengdingensis]
MKKAMITVKDLRKVYKLGSEKVIALDDINVTIYTGEVCCILGTSGSGKSTLLNMLAGLERPTRGQVLIGKRDIARMDEASLAKFRQKYVGFVFQSYNLMSSLTALENVSMPLMFKGVGKGVRNKAARQMLKSVGLGNRCDHKPTQMSGGQQQRVGIARAFVSKPRIVFADEPTGNLDTKTTIEVMQLMVQMARENDQTLVIVTHDPEIAEYADRVIHLIDGKIVSDISRGPGMDHLVLEGQFSNQETVHHTEESPPEEPLILEEDDPDVEEELRLEPEGGELPAGSTGGKVEP